jgi:hypothetical protein
MTDNLGVFNLDIYQEIIQNSNVSTITRLSMVCKNFDILCSNKQMWKSIFQSKNFYIDENLTTSGQFISEYRKISYAEFIPEHLINLILSFKNDDFCSIIMKIYIDIINIDNSKLVKVLPADLSIKFLDCKSLWNISKINVTLELHPTIKIIYDIKGFPKDGIGKCSCDGFISCTIDDIKDIIRNLLYYCPDVKLYNFTGSEWISIYSTNKSKDYWTKCFEDYKMLYFQ